MRITPLLNPLSNDFKCWETFKNELSVTQKVAAVAAAILGTIIPVLGTTYAFRKVVLHYERPIQLEKAWAKSGKIRLDYLLPPDSSKLVKKLSQLGIGPNDTPFENLWIVWFRPSCGNNLDTMDAHAQFGVDTPIPYIKSALQNRTGLFVFTGEDQYAEKIKYRVANIPGKLQLSYGQVLSGAPLPKDFVDLVKNGFPKK